jgi:hypothetical protein
MPEIRATLTLEIDGTVLPDFPVIRRFTAAEGGAPITQVFAADNDTITFHQIPSITSPNVNVIYLASDQALNLNLNQLTALALQAGGFILLFGVSLQQGTPADDVTVNNPAAATAANVVVLNTGT